MGGCRGVVRRVEARGRTRQTQIGSQGGSSVMIIGVADDNVDDMFLPKTRSCTT